MEHCKFREIFWSVQTLCAIRGKCAAGGATARQKEKGCSAVSTATPKRIQVRFLLDVGAVRVNAPLLTCQAAIIVVAPAGVLDGASEKFGSLGGEGLQH